MSENLDLVRSIYADWERGDFSTADWADPEIEYVIADGLEPGTWSGRMEMAEGFRGFLGGLEGYRLQADEYRELDADHVIAMTGNTGHGKTSGLDLGSLPGRGGAAVFRVRDGRVAKLTFYWDRDRALTDLGLEE
jgi:ketosteroid isomerase-like protein